MTVPCTNPFDSTTAIGDEFGWQAATLVGANEKHVGLPTGEHPVIPTAFTRRKAARSAIAGTLPLPDHCPSLLHGPGALRACKTAILDGALPAGVSGVVDNGSVFSISPGARKSQPRGGSLNILAVALQTFLERTANVVVIVLNVNSQFRHRTVFSLPTALPDS